LPQGIFARVARWSLGAQDCDVHVIHPSVSRRHVAVHVGPPLQVEDLGSANGTLMNGTPLQAHQATSLEPGKVVEAGAAVLVVHAPGQAAVSTDCPAHEKIGRKRRSGWGIA